MVETTDLAEDVGPRSGLTPKSARARVLEAFARRVQSHGIRRITMTDLARGLGMSKKTLYENFDNKEDVLNQLVLGWADELRRKLSDADRASTTADDAVRSVSLAYSDQLDSFSPQFWEELPRDYPAVHQVVASALLDANRQTRQVLSAFLRPDVAPRIATETFLAMIARAGDPAVCERLGMTRRDLTLAALEVWGHGALAGRRSPGSDLDR